MSDVIGDIDGDGSVAFSDFIVLSSNYGQVLCELATENLDSASF